MWVDGVVLKAAYSWYLKITSSKLKKRPSWQEIKQGWPLKQELLLQLKYDGANLDVPVQKV